MNSSDNKLNPKLAINALLLTQNKATEEPSEKKRRLTSESISSVCGYPFILDAISVAIID